MSNYDIPTKKWFKKFDTQVSAQSDKTYVIRLTEDCVNQLKSLDDIQEVVGPNYIPIKCLGMPGMVLVGCSGSHDIQTLSKNKNIASIDNNRTFFMYAQPNDSRYGDSGHWGMNSSKGSYHINVEDVWDSFTGDANIVVGVVDTGINYNHPDLKDNVWINPNETSNGLDDDNNGYVDDIHGINTINGTGNPNDDQSHGSHCAGTIGAVGNNGQGVAGVNWTVKMFGAKFLDNNGRGSYADAIESVNYCTTLKQAGVNIKCLNHSWGGPIDPDSEVAMKAAFKACYQAGIMHIMAAGNNATNNDAIPRSPSYMSPADLGGEGTIVVGSHTVSGNSSSFSNYGANTVDIFAPGSNVISTVLGSSYGAKSGTSMATPHVCGAFALLCGLHPNKSIDEIRTGLLAGAKKLSNFTGRCVTGGILDVKQAHQILSGTPSPPPPPPPGPPPPPPPGPPPPPPPPGPPPPPPPPGPPPPPPPPQPTPTPSPTSKPDTNYGGSGPCGSDYILNILPNSLYEDTGKKICFRIGGRQCCIINGVIRYSWPTCSILKEPTPTPTMTPTASPTPTLTPTITPSISVTPSVTPSVSITATCTPSPTVTTTPSITPSVTPTISLTPSVTPTISQTPTTTPSVTPTISVTPSVTPTISVTPSITPTISVTPSLTPTISVTPTITPPVTASPTPTISITPTISVTPSITPSNTPTISVTPSITPTTTPSYSPTVTPTATPTVTPTLSLTAAIELSKVEQIDDTVNYRGWDIIKHPNKNIVFTVDTSMGINMHSYNSYYPRLLSFIPLPKYVFGIDLNITSNVLAVANYAYGVQLIGFDLNHLKGGMQYLNRFTANQIRAGIPGYSGSIDIRDIKFVSVPEGGENKSYLYATDLYYGLLTLELSGNDITLLAHNKYNHPDYPPTDTRNYSFSRFWELVVSADQNYLFAGCFENILVIYDITNKTSPVEIAAIDLLPAERKAGGIYDILQDPYNSDLLYVSMSTRGLFIIDIANPSSPIILSHLPLYSSATPGTLERTLTLHGIVPKAPPPSED